MACLFNLNGRILKERKRTSLSSILIQTCLRGKNKWLVYLCMHRFICFLFNWNVHGSNPEHMHSASSSCFISSFIIFRCCNSLSIDFSKLTSRKKKKFIFFFYNLEPIPRLALIGPACNSQHSWPITVAHGMGYRPFGRAWVLCSTSGVMMKKCLPRECDLRERKIHDLTQRRKNKYSSPENK